MARENFLKEEEREPRKNKENGCLCCTAADVQKDCDSNTLEACR